MYTISTQLAKAVFDIGDFFYKDSPTESVKIENGIITYTVGKSSFDKPIDSFFFMCKYWALKQKYTITPIVILSGKNYLKYILDVRSFHNPSIDRRAFVYFRDYRPKIYNSEQQAVFDACQWILDTKGV